MSLRRAADLLRRCTSATTRPLLVLALLVLVDVSVTGALPPEVRDQLPMGGVRAVLAGALLLWLLVRVAWAALQPRRDRAAAEHLALLRDGATVPGCALVQVVAIAWTATAGTRATCVDVNTGLTHDLWFPETSPPVGAFFLVRLDGYVGRPVDWLRAADAEAAHRSTATRKRAEQGPVAEAERLLRGT
jgi:hypothetical protein